MGATIWETVAANKIEPGDIISWHASFDPDRVCDDSHRVRVCEVTERAADVEPLPYVVVRVDGPTDPFERMSGVTTSRTYRQGDPVRRMLSARAARVSDTNLRSVK